MLSLLSNTLSNTHSLSGYKCVCYHGGLDASQRQRAQQQFNTGSANVVVATVAFGMGVDKCKIRDIDRSLAYL